MHLKLFLYLVRIYILSACDDQVRPPGLYVKLSFSVNMTEVSSIKPAVTIKDALIACGIEIAVKSLRTFEPYTARIQCRNRLAIFVTYCHIVIPEYNADAFLRDLPADPVAIYGPIPMPDSPGAFRRVFPYRYPWI